MHVIVAPDKFTGSATAAEVAAFLAAGLSSARPDVEIRQLPVADGGDGTVAAAVAAGYEWVPITASGPDGDPVSTGYARRGRTAIVELAAICGLSRLASGAAAPLRASSFGFGEAVQTAMRAGARRVVLAVGGSASTDGGAGFLQGLGVRVSIADGGPVARGGRALVDVADVAGADLAVAPGLGGVEFVLAGDVTNPLLGPSGAAAVFGPQKGASPEDVIELDGALTHWADVVAATTGYDHRATPGAGAAGGVGFAAIAVLGASVRPGIDVVLELIGFADQLPGCGLVVTGEGALDRQTLAGKAPFGVAAAARQAAVPVVAVCGRNELDGAALALAGIDAVYALTDIEPDVARCVAEPGPLLARVGAIVARAHLTRPDRPQR